MRALKYQQVQYYYYTPPPGLLTTKQGSKFWAVFLLCRQCCVWGQIQIRITQITCFAMTCDSQTLSSTWHWVLAGYRVPNIKISGVTHSMDYSGYTLKISVRSRLYLLSRLLATSFFIAREDKRQLPHCSEKKTRFDSWTSGPSLLYFCDTSGYS